jgi:hypothetical protein
MSMRRLIIPFAAAAMVAACYDAPSTPSAQTSSLRPASALFDGDPPPPPVSGEGLADFTAFEAADASETACSVSDTFKFAYRYFSNGPDKNAYLVMNNGKGVDVTVLETTKLIVAKGTVTRPGYSFRIDDVVGGTIKNKGSGIPPRIVLQFTGMLRVEKERCVANAMLSVQLAPGQVDPVPPPQ